MSSRDRLSASELLDRKAEQLARRHHRRLDEMGDAALRPGTNRTPDWLFPRPALAMASVLIAVLIYWTLPASDRSGVTSTPQTVTLPDWVLDEQVPLEILEAPEFYRWLADQIANETARQG
ncbi:MAG TPA: hypothetical protein ENJ43_03680 [Gammaproteobacteria bacterium]|nr:hypothetical protein [Gammaproteobacteria bacterium]